MHELLQRFGARLLGAEGARARVLVPLCGKTLDLTYFAERCSAPVVGVEFVESAVEAFFAEHDLAATRTLHSTGGWPVYRGGDVELHAGDIFDVLPHLGRFDAIYDRAALVALAPEPRRRYAGLLREALAPGGRILLSTTDYDQNEMTGPPYAVSLEEVSRHYETLQMELLEDMDIFDAQGRFAKRGLTWQRGATHLITRAT